MFNVGDKVKYGKSSTTYTIQEVYRNTEQVKLIGLDRLYGFDNFRLVERASLVTVESLRDVVKSLREQGYTITVDITWPVKTEII